MTNSFWMTVARSDRILNSRRIRWDKSDVWIVAAKDLDRIERLSMGEYTAQAAAEKSVYLHTETHYGIAVIGHYNELNTYITGRIRMRQKGVLK